MNIGNKYTLLYELFNVLTLLLPRLTDAEEESLLQEIHNKYKELKEDNQK